MEFMGAGDGGRDMTPIHIQIDSYLIGIETYTHQNNIHYSSSLHSHTSLHVTDNKNNPAPSQSSLLFPSESRRGFKQTFSLRYNACAAHLYP